MAYKKMMTLDELHWKLTEQAERLEQNLTREEQDMEKLRLANANMLLGAHKLKAQMGQGVRASNGAINYLLQEENKQQSKQIN